MLINKEIEEKSVLQKYDNINPVTLDYLLSIDIHHPAILDVGCWTGTLGRALKDNGFACVIDGIDSDQSALQIAKKESGYEQVYHCDINSLMSSDIIRERYDIIVLGDVLEHIIDPGRLLRCLLSKLSDKGCYIVSLPNIAFFKYRLLHLFGNWKYTETGIMDKTHLRFFTVPSMKLFFKENSLEIIDFKELVAVPRLYWPVKLLAKFWPNMFALQMVFKLRPRKDS